MSSSPLPSLTELVAHTSQLVPKACRVSPPPHHASIPSYCDVAPSKSKNLTSETPIDLTEPFTIEKQSKFFLNIGKVDVLLNNTSSPIGTSLNSKHQPKSIVTFEITTTQSHNTLRREKVDEEPEKIRIAQTGKTSESQDSVSKKIDDIEQVSSPKSRTNLNLSKSFKHRSGGENGRLKDEKSTQSKLQKGKVTKLCVSLTSTSKLQESIEFPRNLLTDTKNPVIHVHEQRQDSTPPVCTDNATIAPPHNQDVYESIPSNSTLAIDNQKKINKFFNNFIHVESAKSSPNTKRTPPKVIGKRKLIELVKRNSSVPGNTKSEKGPKKKARTLTELSTSVYLEDCEHESTIISPEFPMYKSRESITTKSKSSNLRIKKNPSRKKSNNCQVSNSTLLSPESALRQVSTQEFVFGTSSQIAGEGSPNSFRDSCKAVKASNQSDDPFLSSPVSSPGPKKCLWNAASRNLDGKLLNTELVDLTVSPDKGKSTIPSPILLQESYFEVNKTLLDTVISRPSQFGSVSRTNSLSDQSSRNHIHTIISTSSSLENQNDSKKRVNCRDESSVKLPVPLLADQIPDFESYTNAQLAEQISEYHFKPVKKRTHMISLLQKCWKGKQRMKLNNLNVNTRCNNTTICDEADNCDSSATNDHRRTKSGVQNSGSIPVVSALRENLVGSWEVENCSKPLSQARSPKNSRKKSKDFGSLTEEEERCRSQFNSVTCLTQSSSPERSPTSSLELVSSHITQAIKSMTPSKEVKNPNWYEKILLYDPIVIEDLTAWLNTGALQKTNWDGEVSPKLVKKWCDTKSICCLWKENPRGATRNRS